MNECCAYKKKHAEWKEEEEEEVGVSRRDSFFHVECVHIHTKIKKGTLEKEGPGNLWTVVFMYIYACRKGLFIIARAQR